MQRFSELSFASQFKLLWACMVGAMALVLGFWSAQEIENSTRQHTAELVSAYVRGIFEPHLAASAMPNTAVPRDVQQLFQAAPLNAQVKQVKVWDQSGTIIYSSERQLIGTRYEVDASLKLAFSGQTVAHLASLETLPHAYDRSLGAALLEVYVPLWRDQQALPWLVVEIYHSTDHLLADIQAAQWRSWALVLGVSSLAYLCLSWLVTRANQTIRKQGEQLQSRLSELHQSLQENQRMQQDLKEAGEKVTFLNEAFLKRIAADIHDGPAQGIAFSAMHLEAQQSAASPAPVQAQEQQRILSALRSSLADLRAITRDLALPGLDDLDLESLVHRCVAQCRQHQPMEVRLHLDAARVNASLVVKQSLFRVLQEGLSNAVKHGQEHHIDVHLKTEAGDIQLCIQDHGHGMRDPLSADGMGLQLMQERVKLLGGHFTLQSKPGTGVTLYIRLPLNAPAVPIAPGFTEQT